MITEQDKRDIENTTNILYSIGEWICEVSNIAEDDTEEENQHIIKMYGALDVAIEWLLRIKGGEI